MLVSGAAGAVGSLVGQLGKLHGCRVIGIAGGPVKCARLTERYGFDAAIDYQGKSVAELTDAIATCAPEGIDIVFRERRRRRARCRFDESQIARASGVVRLDQRIQLHDRTCRHPQISGSSSSRRASIHGMFSGDYLDRFAESQTKMGAWLSAGKIKVDEQIETGIENAVPAFLRLFSGAHDGKLILKIA